MIAALLELCLCFFPDLLGVTSIYTLLSALLLYTLAAASYFLIYSCLLPFTLSTNSETILKEKNPGTGTLNLYQPDDLSKSSVYKAYGYRFTVVSPLISYAAINLK